MVNPEPLPNTNMINYQYPALLSLVIPMYNESDRFHLLEEAIEDFVQEWTAPLEIILVNDGSKDNTWQLLEEGYVDKSTATTNYVLVNVQPNQGKGNALKEGVMVATGSHILTLDADMAAHPRELFKWLQYLKAQQFPEDTILIGSREHPDSEIDGSNRRRFLGGIFNSLTQVLTGLSLADTQCGFKLYPHDIAKFIFQKMTISGWSHDVELLHTADFYNISIKAMPLAWADVENSKIAVVSDGIKMALATFSITVQVRFRYFFSYALASLKQPEWVAGKKIESGIFRLLFAISTILCLIALPSYFNALTNNAFLDSYQTYGQALVDSDANNSINLLPNFLQQQPGFWAYLFISIPSSLFKVLLGILGFIAAFFFGLLTKELTQRWLLGWLVLLGFGIVFCSNYALSYLLIPFAAMASFTSYHLCRLLKQLRQPSLLTQIMLSLGVIGVVNSHTNGLLLLVFILLFTSISYVKTYSSIPKKSRLRLWVKLAFWTGLGYFGSLLFWPFAANAPFLGPIQALGYSWQNASIFLPIHLITGLILVALISTVLTLKRT